MQSEKYFVSVENRRKQGERRLVRVAMVSGCMVLRMRKVMATPRRLVLACFHFALSLIFPVAQLDVRRLTWNFFFFIKGYRYFLNKQRCETGNIRAVAAWLDPGPTYVPMTVFATNSKCTEIWYHSKKNENWTDFTNSTRCRSCASTDRSKYCQD